MKPSNPLPHMPILGSSNSAANKDMMSKILTNGDTIFRLDRKHCGKRRNCLLCMEGYLSKKSTHTSDSFSHCNYVGIIVNEYSINIAYMTIFTFVTCR